MTRVEHYKGLHNNIDKLYQEIKQELENEKNLRIVAEMKGGMNGITKYNLPLYRYYKSSKTDIVKSILTHDIR